MSIRNTTELILDHTFDPKTCRHYINGQLSVLHCHHYATLYSQLADDCAFFNAKKLMADVAEDTFREALSWYYTEHEIESLEERIRIAEQYYSAIGMGKMRVVHLGTDSGEVELIRSHIDEGWLKKWGERDKPVNFITCGYIAGMFSAILGKPPRTFKVTESQSIVSGAEKSCFKVVAL